MIVKMHRDHAKKLLAKHYLTLTTLEQKLEYLEYFEGLWIFNDSAEDIRKEIAKGEIPKISDELIKSMAQTESSQYSFFDPHDLEKLETLIVEELFNEFDKVLNSYLESSLRDIDFVYEVYGEVEVAGVCPCCHYYSIGAGLDGFHEICTVCFWQNGGDSPNYMSLEEAQANFAKFGSMNESALNFLDPDRAHKYAKKND